MFLNYKFLNSIDPIVGRYPSAHPPNFTHSKFSSNLFRIQRNHFEFLKNTRGTILCHDFSPRGAPHPTPTHFLVCLYRMTSEVE